MIKQQTDTLIGQIKTKSQDTPELKMNKQKQTFSFPPPINLVEEGKWLLAVTPFELTNSLFKVLDKNNTFTITILGYWNSKSGEKSFTELN